MNELDRALRPMFWWLARWVDYQNQPPRWLPVIPENWIMQALEKADRQAAMVQLRWEGERRERKRAAGS